MKKSIYIIILVIIIAVGIAWYLISPAFKVVEKNENIPLTSDSLAEGIFIQSAHEVKGKALLIENEQKKILRFEDFETINGPDLHIYLASSLDAGDYIDLGAIKGTKGNINYDIPDGIDINKYNKVLIWCVPFKVLFSYAELS
ncbi:MAG: DM13 domain-containing protein [Nanoarchaeota archaeon]